MITATHPDHLRPGDILYAPELGDALRYAGPTPGIQLTGTRTAVTHPGALFALCPSVIIISRDTNTVSDIRSWPLHRVTTSASTSPSPPADDPSQRPGSAVS